MTLPIDFEANPLVPAVIQDDSSGVVLMVGFMNQLAFEKTQETGFVHFWSRSRNALWKKGETSGHTQEVIAIALNCEENSLLIQVIQKAAVCHTGHTTCFYRQILPDGSLFETSDPVFDPNDVYESGHPVTNASQPADPGRIREWYGAYEYLAREPLQDVSGTSKRLHDRVLPFDRIADELDEFAGVLAGQHSHSGDLAEDVVLEGSQVLYWLNLLAISLAQDWDRDLDLGTVMLSPGHVHESTERSVEELRDSSTTWRLAETRFGKAPDDSIRELVEMLSNTYLFVARAVSPVVNSSRLIEHDLEELRSKPYLADYFSTVEG